MKWLQQLRQQLGWTQETMALYLGVHRSLLAMAETRQRDLSTAKRSKAIKLKSLYNSAIKEDQENPVLEEQLKKLYAEADDERKRQQADARLALQRAERRLQRMKHAYQEAENQLKCLPRLRYAISHEAPAILLQCDLQETTSLRTMKKNSPAAQYRLSLRIAQLRAGLEV